MTAMFSLAGKVALVTGASRGIGRAIAREMAAAGASVLVSDIDIHGCGQVAQELRAGGAQAWALPCDVVDAAQLQALADATLERAGRIDILVCNAGVAPHAGPLVTASDADYMLTMEVNLRSNLRLCNMVIPQMAARRDGVVIIMSSIAGVRGNKAIGLYGLSKAANAQLARNLAVEWGPDNIRVNAISPGVIDTEFARPIAGDAERAAKRIALTPLRRFGTAREIAGVALFLASEAGQFVTGQNLVVDGGTTIGDGS
ncbi:MAG: SDR family oxidoreductase [Pseudomonadota bacterium]